MLKCFDFGVIPLECSATIGPRAVYDSIKDDPAMKGVVCDETFTRRLNDLSNQIIGSADRAIADKEACDNFMANHPRPMHNIRGEPRWDGSKAQEHMKKDMKEGKHIMKNGERMTLAQFRCLRPAHQDFLLPTMRAHIDQEIRLQNCLNWLETEENVG